VQLFVSDLDGTLAGVRARLSPFTRRQLRELLRAGLSFTVASARSIHSLAPLLQGLPITLPVAELNGAFITDLRTQKAMLCHSLAPHVADATIRQALEADLPPFVSTFAAGEQRLYPPLSLLSAGIAWYDSSRRAARDPRLRAATDPRALLDQAITSLTLIGARPRLASLALGVESQFPGQTQMLLTENQHQPGWYWLTVQSCQASKAHALKAIAAGAGVQLAKTTVFGDEVNDIPMFQVAGRGVAVQNAIAALKRVAHEVIGPHHEDSVVRYLLERR
jgi:hydroxymethylpyrimidine pyrophosphatase-like HAD family hydrolase